jgi:hypothetical protein
MIAVLKISLLGFNAAAFIHHIVAKVEEGISILCGIVFGLGS